MTDAPPTARPRVLYLTHRVPFPPDKGDRIRNYHLLRHLARRARVWLLALADEPVEDAHRTQLESVCERVEVVRVSRRTRWGRALVAAATGRSLSEGLFHSPAADRVARAWAAEAGFAAAVVSASSLAPYLGRSGLGRIPGVIDLMDVDSQKWLDFAADAGPLKRLVYRFEASRVRKLERSLPRWARGISLVSQAEADVFEGFAGAGTVTVATNGVDLDYFRPAVGPGDGSCVFVGALDYHPNIDAAVWFTNAVWPEVRRRHPAALFRVVGRSPTPAVRSLAAVPGVEVVGTVPDVRPYVASASVVVVPLRLARGVQNKVLEALAMARPTVAAPAALAALDVAPGRHLLSASSPADWADAVGGLLADPDRGRALGRAGRQFVETHHHWDDCLRPLLDKIVPPTPTLARADLSDLTPRTLVPRL